ncbi:E3 SUMO-protein ligase ZBED1-like [Parasteatoda tepidariorum]|uniref:E3 SUMO-protein ligase ZBED1-like n=1 Tax=Parasteatoda tepidariorum TaxID=114398 RepID=UPI001C720E08|nr:E3 SUMO-protein ligase ZBED1-like [Parasteatoda tepidariorum]
MDALTDCPGYCKLIVVCKLCSKTVGSKSGGTSNLTSHLKHHHPLKFRELNTSSKQLTRSTIPAIDVDDPSAPVDAKQNPSESVKKWQKTMLDFQPLDSKSSKNCTEAVAKFIATSMQPFATVENPKFIEMVRVLNPKYKLPGRKHFSTVAIPKLYNDTVEKIKAKISSIQSCDIAITTDCWTSITNTPFLAVTAHFISNEWQLLSACLNCKHFIEDHTSENLIEMLSNTLKDWNIDVKTLPSITSDNGTNIVKAIRDLKNISVMDALTDCP